jgi:Predicted integral membrane protein (DUF2269)
MSSYTIALFFHVSGAIGYCVGIGAWVFSLLVLRRAQRVEQVRILINLTNLAGPFSGICVLLLLASGLYMAFTAWSLRTGWILVALISLILMIPSSAILIARRRSALDRLAREAPDGALSATLAQRTHDPVLPTVMQTIAALLLGLVFLMTTKPELAISLVVMVVALLLGLASGLLVSRMRRASGQVQELRNEEV